MSCVSAVLASSVCAVCCNCARKLSSFRFCNNRLPCCPPSLCSCLLPESSVLFSCAFCTGTFSPLSGTCVTVASVVSTVDSSVVTATFSVLSVSTVITGSATVSCVICVTASCHFSGDSCNSSCACPVSSFCRSIIPFTSLYRFSSVSNANESCAPLTAISNSFSFPGSVRSTSVIPRSSMVACSSSSLTENVSVICWIRFCTTVPTTS